MPLSEPHDRDAFAWLVATHGRRRVSAWLQTLGDPAAVVARYRPHPDHLRDFTLSLQQSGATLLQPWDDDYPPLLAAIPDAPLTLYVCGERKPLLQPSIAIVGARRCTPAGNSIAERLAAGCAAAGLVVVSGLARGIDAAAHRGTLATGTTISVLGGGVGQIYPAANRPLARRILERGGSLVSEYPPAVTPRPFHFPERNRLVSGLALGVLVVEASAGSGSLITARLALEQGREVMAVPGSILNPVARGCHDLLRDGAALIQTPEDVFEVIGWASTACDNRASPSSPASAPGRPDDPELRRVLDVIDSVETPIDLICGRLGESVSSLSEILLQLELSGFVVRGAAGYSLAAGADGRG